MIRRPPRSTQSRSSAASDVYKRQIFSLLIVSRLESTSSRTTCNHGITHPMSPGIINARIIRRETLWTRNGHADSLAELRTDSGPKCYHLRATAARIALGGRRDCALKRSLACIVSFCSRSSRTSTANRCTAQSGVTSSAGVRDVMTAHRLLTSLFLVWLQRSADTHYILTGKCQFYDKVHCADKSLKSRRQLQYNTIQ